MKKELTILVMSAALCLGACQTHQSSCTTGTCRACTSCRREITVDKTPAYFAFDSAKLTSGDRTNLDKVAERLKANPSEKILIAGYADMTGPAAYNMRLSQRRAESAAMYLQSLSIAHDRISTVGYGATHFADTNTTEIGRAKNRRVEVSFSK